MATSAIQSQGLTAPLPTGRAWKPKTVEQKRRISERRRERVDETRLREEGPDRKQALDFAQQLVQLADASPDPETRSDLYKVVRRLRVRTTPKEDVKRDAVLKSLEKWDSMSAREIMEETGLSKEDVATALAGLTSAAFDMVEIFTRGGRRNSGRGGTTLYYRMRHNNGPRS